MLWAHSPSRHGQTGIVVAVPLALTLKAPCAVMGREGGHVMEQCLQNTKPSDIFRKKQLKGEPESASANKRALIKAQESAATLKLPL